MSSLEKLLIYLHFKCYSSCEINYGIKLSSIVVYHSVFNFVLDIFVGVVILISNLIVFFLCFVAENRFRHNGALSVEIIPWSHLDKVNRIFDLTL